VKSVGVSGSWNHPTIRRSAEKMYGCWGADKNGEREKDEDEKADTEGDDKEEEEEEV
jgi:hypothetical protein